MSILDFIKFCYGKSKLDAMSGQCQRPLSILRAWVGSFSEDIIRFEFLSHMTVITMTMTTTMTMTMITETMTLTMMTKSLRLFSICLAGGAQLLSKYNGLPCRGA